MLHKHTMQLKLRDQFNSVTLSKHNCSEIKLLQEGVRRGLETDFSVVSLGKKISMKATSINESQMELDRNYFAILSALVGTQGFRKISFVETHLGTLCCLL